MLEGEVKSIRLYSCYLRALRFHTPTLGLVIEWNAFSSARDTMFTLCRCPRYPNTRHVDIILKMVNLPKLTWLRYEQSNAEALNTKKLVAIQVYIAVLSSREKFNIFKEIVRVGSKIYGSVYKRLQANWNCIWWNWQYKHIPKQEENVWLLFIRICKKS